MKDYSSTVSSSAHTMFTMSIGQGHLMATAGS